MRMLKTIVRTSDLKNHKVTVSETQAKRSGNVNNYLFKKFEKRNVNSIVVKVKGNHGKTYEERTYDKDLEYYLVSGRRVEVTWKKGYEDYSGYGNRTNGRKGRYYIGRSTGWIPIYLQIHNTRSTGGGGLCISGIEDIVMLNSSRK